MLWYAIATILPALLLVLACLFGGVFALLSVLSITVFVFFMDKRARHLPQISGTGHGLSLILAGIHFPLLVLGVWSLGAGTGLSPIDKLLIFTGLGLYLGQISNSNAHELIHASTRLRRLIGAAIYITLLHGHHVSAHLRVHHVHAATDKDPNSAGPGEGFWSFALRALRGEFTAGLRAETIHRARASKQLTRFSHPYIAYILGAAAVVSFCYGIAGSKGAAAYFAVAFYAQLQLLLSDYVQHYGLRRRAGANGKPEPIGPQHSWNAPTWYSNAMMLNAPKHSDHHIHPARAFPALILTPETMPVLPHSLPMMAVIALIPPLWRRIMDRRVARWQDRA